MVTLESTLGIASMPVIHLHGDDEQRAASRKRLSQYLTVNGGFGAVTFCPGDLDDEDTSK